MRISLLSLFLFTIIGAYAQIPIDFNLETYHGPVEKVVVTNTITQYMSGSENMTDISATEVIVQDGRTQSIRDLDDSPFGGVVQEFNWQDDRLIDIRIYTKRSDELSLFKYHQPLYDQQGKIQGENIFYHPKDLRASLVYDYKTSLEGDDILEMTLYKHDEPDPQGYYYLAHNQQGHLLRKIIAVPPDTGLQVTLLENQGDSVFISKHIASSRERRGEKDTLQTEERYRYDQYGNVTEHRLTIIPLSNTEMGRFEMVSQSVYVYTGESAPTPKASTVENILTDSWVSTLYDIRLVMEPSEYDNYGNFSLEYLPSDSGLAIDGSGWFFRLRDRAPLTGEWQYDGTTNSLTLRQGETILQQLSLSARNNKLYLKDYSPDAETLILERE